jgi:hypothetical protein
MKNENCELEGQGKNCGAIPGSFPGMPTLDCREVKFQQEDFKVKLNILDLNDVGIYTPQLGRLLNGDSLTITRRISP